MTEVIIKVPSEIKSIVGDIDEPLYIETLKEIARKKVKEKKKKLKQMQRRIEQFKAHYALTLEEFSNSLPDTQKAHEDWMEWTFLSEAVNELQATINKLERVMSE